MKRIFLLTCFIIALFSSVCLANVGEVEYCDGFRLVVRSDYGYTCAHGIIFDYLNGGPDFTVYVGDFVYGTFCSYGSHRIYDRTMNISFDVWIDDFALSRDQANYWLANN